MLRAPLQGSGWIAFNGFLEADHRRSFMTIDGKMRIAQRFAIDWARIGKDGLLFHGDSKSNSNFYSYGAKVVAVANGRICDLKDGLPDNPGSNERTDRVVTLDNITGNYVTIDLGQGRFAFYAHLQLGSLKVKLGDKVTAGQVLGLLGNSGNSDEPHLHFQIMDTNSPLCSEGIPYVLENYTQLGQMTGPDTLDKGEPWMPTSKDKPIIHQRDFPVNSAVVSFP